MNWNSFAPENWKKSTLKMLIKRAYTICIQEYLLETELQHLERVFIEINGYPSEVVRRIIQQVKRKNRETSTEVANIEPTTERPKETLIILPYAGVQGEKIGKEIISVMKPVFQDKVVTKVAFKAKKLSSCFNIKDKNPIQYEHNLVYRINCPDCSATYIGETARRMEERVQDHNKRDKNPHVLKHSKER